MRKEDFNRLKTACRFTPDSDMCVITIPGSDGKARRRLKRKSIAKDNSRWHMVKTIK